MKPINWSSEAEVTNFDRAVSVYKYITRLQITMNDLSIMHVLQAVEDAPNEVFDLDDFQIVLGFDYFPEITVTIVHDKVDFVIVYWLLLVRNNDFNQFGDILMVQFLQQF